MKHLLISSSFISSIVTELSSSETGHVLVPLLSKHLRNLNPEIKKNHSEFIAKQYSNNKKAKKAIRSIADIKRFIKLSGPVTGFKVLVPTKTLLLFNEDLYEIAIDLSNGVYKFLYKIDLELTTGSEVTKTNLADFLITFYNLEETND